VAAPTFKVLIFLKRRPGMPLEAFCDYYEGVHSKLCAKLMIGASRYVRRYVEPRPNSLTGKDDELEFDVITELWYDDRAVFEKAVDLSSRGRLPADVLADEERLFDRSKTRYATVVEFDSELSRRTDRPGSA